MDKDTCQLKKEGNRYFLTNTKRFEAYISKLQYPKGTQSNPFHENLKEDTKECFNFAYNMSYGELGKHRDSRSGGKLHRTKGQIFINTFQGKMAEFALYRYFQEFNIEVEKPDTSEYDLGKWDSFDLECQGKHLSVKSTKYYGNLLLLETKDWNSNGEYIPNLQSGTTKYDYIILVRLFPDGDDLMKKQRLLYQKDAEIPTNIRDILENVILKQDWTYDFPGFIYHNELVKLIQEKQILPQNALLGKGNTTMDAQNYYVQTGNMHSLAEIYTPNINERIDPYAKLRLKRKCPRCGKELKLRHRYSWFWGCQGYFDEPSCTYREPL